MRYYGRICPIGIDLVWNACEHKAGFLPSPSPFALFHIVGPFDEHGSLLATSPTLPCFCAGVQSPHGGRTELRELLPRIRRFANHQINIRRLLLRKRYEALNRHRLTTESTGMPCGLLLRLTAPPAIFAFERTKRSCSMQSAICFAMRNAIPCRPSAIVKTRQLLCGCWLPTSASGS